MRVYQFRHVGTDAAICLFTAYYYYCVLLLLRTTTMNYSLLVVVPTEGLEPPHPKAHGPEPCASTNSATWALCCYYSLLSLRVLQRGQNHKGWRAFGQ